jgi:hypothetical protein
MSRRILGALPVVIGVAAAVAACGSQASTAPPATSHTTRPATSHTASAPVAVPAGYRRVGGSAQGISIAIPTSWVAIDLAKETMQQAAKAVQIKGVSSSALLQAMEQLQKLHAIVVYDLRSVTAGPSHFATNLNAYCTPSGVNNTGSSGVPIIKQEAVSQLQQAGAQHFTQQDVTIGGVPGVQTSYQLSSGSGTIYATQLEVLPAQDKACYVTLTGTKGQFPTADMEVFASTAQFP